MTRISCDDDTHQRWWHASANCCTKLWWSRTRLHRIMYILFNMYLYNSFATTSCAANLMNNVGAEWCDNWILRQLIYLWSLFHLVALYKGHLMGMSHTSLYEKKKKNIQMICLLLLLKMFLRCRATLNILFVGLLDQNAWIYWLYFCVLVSCSSSGNKTKELLWKWKWLNKTWMKNTIKFLSLNPCFVLYYTQLLYSIYKVNSIHV